MFRICTKLEGILLFCCNVCLFVCVFGLNNCYANTFIYSVNATHLDL